MNKLNPLFLALFFILNSSGFAQELVNGGFEILSQKSIVRNWMIEPGKSPYTIHLDSNDKHSGRYALRLTDTAMVTNDNNKEAIIANTFGMMSATKVVSVEIHAWVKYSNASDSTVAIFFQPVKGNSIVRSYASSSAKTRDKWQQVTLTFHVDKRSPLYAFYYGFKIKAKGKVWIDDIEITVNGHRVKDPESFQFEPTANNLKWLNANLSPLRMSNENDLQKDLIPLGQFAADAKIISLGEPTHGTHEAFKFKLSTIKYLVANKGFTTIALEEVIPTCDIMNRVVNMDNTSIKDSLMSLPFYKLYKTAEMVELFEWVSDYNRKNPDRKVKIVGFDMEDIQIKASRNLLRNYGNQQSQVIYNLVRKIDDGLDGLLKVNKGRLTKENMVKVADQLKIDFKDLHRLLEHENRRSENQSELFKLSTYVRICEQWLESRFYDGNRDEYMAQNIKFYSEHFPKEKLILWAHNFHVANHQSQTIKTMGAYLKDFYGQDIVSISFTSAQGYYAAADNYSGKNWDVFPFEKAYRGTYEYILAKASQETYFLPMDQKPKHASRNSWLGKSMKHLNNRYVKSGMGDDYEFHSNLNLAFDGVVFCRETTASQSFLIK